MGQKLYYLEHNSLFEYSLLSMSSDIQEQKHELPFAPYPFGGEAMISHTETSSIFKTGGRNYDPLESAYNDYRDVFEFFFTAGQASVIRRPYLN